MGITKEEVEKLEGAKSIPEISKVVCFSELFGVTTDYLLKDKVEHNSFKDSYDEVPITRRVSINEAREFIALKSVTAKYIAIATFLCIVSPIFLMLLGAASERYSLSENVAVGIGMAILLIIISIAVGIFIFSWGKVNDFKYLSEEVFEIDYDVIEMVEQKKK